MEPRAALDHCLQVSLVLVCVYTVVAQGYMGSSCRHCMHTGDWVSCTQCYNSKPGVVPFFGMRKRSGSSEYNDENSHEINGVYEVRKRASYLVSYCCMRFHDDECCSELGITPYFGKRSPLPEEYEIVYSSSECLYCAERDSFDVDYCLKCVKKRK